MNKIILTLCLTILTTLFSVNGYCQNPTQQKNTGVNNFGLNLTETQKNKIEEIKNSDSKRLLEINNLIREKRAHLNTIRCVDKPNMDEINSTIEEIGNLNIEKEKINEKQHQEIRKILTDEQRIKFDSKQEFGNGYNHPQGHHKNHNLEHHGNHNLEQHKNHKNCHKSCDKQNCPNKTEGKN
ncbi:MAG: Spy/CpxP family protein refolding chaperone [Bacteroidales bacterium]|nr:Spy/CpxP family protein refolding chaperone [Bacteroidales bacterium]